MVSQAITAIQLRRRLIHASLALLPLIYYEYLPFVPLILKDKAQITIFVLASTLIGVDIVRIIFKLNVSGQREYEKQRLSGASFALIGIIIVLLFSPSHADKTSVFSIPIIWSCAFGDPILSLTRSANFSNIICEFIGGLAILLIWLGAWYYLNTPLWVIPLIVPIILLSEWPNIVWLDDNLLMMLAPLMFLTILY